MFERQKQIRWSALKSGVVITLAVLVLVVTVFFAGGIEDIFQPRGNVVAVIKDVKGLRKGAPVWVSGVEIGFVRKIHLDPAEGTLVTLTINRKAFDSLKKDTTASVMTMGLLGDKYVELSPGTPGAGSLVPGQRIKSLNQIEFADIMDTSAASLHKMSDLIQKLDALVSEVGHGGGTVGNLLRDPAIHNNLKDSTKTLADILKRIDTARGTAHLLIEDPSLYNDMKKAAAAASEASRDLAEFGHRLNTKSGSLQKLVEDPALYDNLNRASLQLSAVIDRIDKGEGVAGKLVQDDEMAKDFKTAITELKALSGELKTLVQDIREHPKKYFKFSLF